MIGRTTADGGHIRDRPVTPGDLAATLYRHFDIPLDATYPDRTGRPHHLLPDGGTPVKELVG